MQTFKNLKYIEHCNFWTNYAMYIIGKEMRQRIHLWHQIFVKMSIFWEKNSKKTTLYSEQCMCVKWAKTMFRNHSAHSPYPSFVRGTLHLLGWSWSQSDTLTYASNYSKIFFFTEGCSKIGQTVKLSLTHEFRGNWKALVHVSLRSNRQGVCPIDVNVWP